MSLSPPLQAIRIYFASGWAFFMPYLAAYLLYAWLKWPANPAPAAVAGIAGRGFFPPSLLHVYWGLHAMHFVLCAFGMSAWRRVRAAAPPSSRAPLLGSLGPWLCLALIFWIPGIYLEWPADPWEHLRRINEWHAHDAVLAHSTWGKSSYFLVYSIAGQVSGSVQQAMLDLPYTGMCLLLSWQYYRLARAIGLGERASFAFVLLNALTFGNSIFSFYRYYGLSSSIVAQLGGVALTRIALQHFGGAQPPPAARRTVMQVAASSVGLLLLIGFNHGQGLGIAGLGVLAVIVWRLIAWRPASLYWIAASVILLSIATVWWFPRSPEVDDMLRSRGWWTSWYGFNLFDHGSPAFARTLHILGAFGVLNLIAGCWLVVRRNHVAGWLTVTPILTLLLPCIAVPFAHLLVSRGGSLDSIVSFHRFLFAVPMCLALVTASSLWLSSPTVGEKATPPGEDARELRPAWRLNTVAATLLIPALLLFVLTVPSANPGYNRLWHGLQKNPDDLDLSHHVAAWNPRHLALASEAEVLVVGSPLAARVREAFQPSAAWHNFRKLHVTLNAGELDQRLDWLAMLPPGLRPASPDVGMDRARPSTGAVVLEAPPADAPVARQVVSLASRNAPWIRLGAESPEHEFADGRMIVSNPPGKASSPFSPDLIPLDRRRRYRLTSAIQQTGDPAAINYLAVAWYDANRRLLPSNEPQPRGADNPPGWNNGTFSYYGLAGQPAAFTWASYSVSFGLGERAAIPQNAAFFRAGAYLNDQSTPATTVRLTGVALEVVPDYQRYLLVVPSPRSLFTSHSIAGQLSGHWRPNYVGIDEAGATELRAGWARATGSVP